MFGIDIDADWLLVFGFVSIATFVLSLLIIPVIIVRIPEDYFTLRKRDSHWQGRSPVFRACMAVLKNVLGLVLLVMGILMLVLPGQGLLTMLFGIALLDFPGKYALERRMIAYPKVLNSINWIRKKANKPPLSID
ncbi:MAG: PGPGW domain-containing protein [Leucothrix sp.]